MRAIGADDGGWPRLGQLAQLRVAEAANFVIVHHANCLHECIANRRAHEAKAAPRQHLAHRLRFRTLSRNLPQRLVSIPTWRGAGEAPEISRQAAALLLDG